MRPLKDRVQFLVEGGSVVRFHARDGIKQDTDAHHMHGVTVLCSMLAGADASGRTGASAVLLMAASTHDLAEQWASDVSAGAKAALGVKDMLSRVERDKLAEFGFEYESRLDAAESAILSLADQLDCLLYCCREAALGNRRVRLIWGRTCRRLEDLAASAPVDVQLRASLVYEAVKEIWHETTGPSGPAFDVFGSGH